MAIECYECGKNVKYPVTCNGLNLHTECHSEVCGGAVKDYECSKDEKDNPLKVWKDVQAFLEYEIKTDKDSENDTTEKDELLARVKVQIHHEELYGDHGGDCIPKDCYKCKTLIAWPKDSQLKPRCLPNCEANRGKG